MPAIDIDSFIAWVKEKPPGRRRVTIEIGDARSDKITIWVYDYDLMAGQFVSSVDEIDLVSKIKADLSRHLRDALSALNPTELHAVLAEYGLGQVEQVNV